MSSEAAFLSEIRERPEDDAPRLVFADWLDDRGEPERAEFVRCQVRLEALPEWDPDRFGLEERALDLLAEHRPRWTAHLPKWARAEELSFRRGMLESARLSPATFLRHGERLAQLIPLSRVRLDDCVRPDELARLVSAVRLSELEFGWFPDAVSERRFFDNLDSPRLRRLAVRRAYSGPGTPEALADWPGLAGLTDLRLSTTPDGPALFRSPRLGRLTRLALTDSGVDAAGLAALAQAEPLAGLSGLEVGAGGLGEAAADLTGADWPELESFVGGLWQTNDDHVRQLLSSPWAARLRSLEFNYGVGTSGGRLLAAFHPTRLARLGLIQTGLGDSGAAALLGADWLAGLASLRLPGNALTEASAHALASSTRLGRLVRLDLTHNHIDAAGAAAVVGSDRLGALHDLRLSGAHVGDRGFVRLAALPGLTRLRVLELTDDHDVTPAGIAALAASPHVRVVRLGLFGNNLADRGVDVLVKAPWLAGVRELDLARNSIGDAGVRALADCPALSRLRSLNLLINRGLGAASATALAESPHLGRLLTLSVSGGGIDRAARDRLRERFGPGVRFGY
jgi:uncharacterized protein (TIGR02996 family)